MSLPSSPVPVLSNGVQVQALLPNNTAVQLFVPAGDNPVWSADTHARSRPTRRDRSDSDTATGLLSR